MNNVLYYYYFVNLCENDLLDSDMLNKQRQNLPNASKITLYLEERDYLNNISTARINDFKMIEIHRKESCTYPFEYAHCIHHILISFIRFSVTF